MLMSIQEISKATAIPETTIRRYFQVFSDLPEGTKLGRTRKYPPETVDIVKTIHASYQDGLSTVEIQEKLSGTNTAELIEQTETTTLPPQESGSLQADIRALTEAVNGLTEAIKLLPPHYSNISTTDPNSPEEIPIPTTTETSHNHDTTTETQEAQKPGIVESKMDLLVSPPQNHHDATESESPEKEPFSSATTEPPDNHKETTTEVPEDHDTIETSYNHDTTTVSTPKPVEEEPTAEPEPEQVIEPHEPTQAGLFLETEEVEEPESAQTDDDAAREEDSAQVEKIPDWKNKTEYREFLEEVFFQLEDHKGTWQEKADHLNSRGILTAKGNPWKDSNVRKTAGNFKKKRQA